MGFLSGLGKVGRVGANLAGFLPIPGAGALSKIASIGANAAPVLGGLAASRAQGRLAEADTTMSRDRLALERAGMGNDEAYRSWQGQNDLGLTSTRANNDALAQEFAARMGLNEAEATRPDLRASQVIRGDLMHNVQDVNIPDNARVNVAHISGGIRPSALGPNTREAGARLSDLGLSKLGHEDLPSAPTFSRYAPTAAPTSGPLPGLSSLPQAGFMDKLLGVATPALALAGAVGKSMPPKMGSPGGVINPDAMNRATAGAFQLPSERYAGAGAGATPGAMATTPKRRLFPPPPSPYDQVRF